MHIFPNFFSISRFTCCAATSLQKLESYPESINCFPPWTGPYFLLKAMTFSATFSKHRAWCLPKARIKKCHPLKSTPSLLKQPGFAWGIDLWMDCWNYCLIRRLKWPKLMWLSLGLFRGVHSCVNYVHMTAWHFKELLLDLWRRTNIPNADWVKM